MKEKNRNASERALRDDLRMLPDLNRDIVANTGGVPNSNNPIPVDVLGSYTGIPIDGDDPVQDADDL